MEDEEAVTTESIEVDADVPAPWYPAWAPWILWPVVVAVVVVALSEWPKRWWFKPTEAWKTAKRDRDKALLLSPLLLLLGAAIGTPIYTAAGLLDTPLLNTALGAATGVFAAPLYDMGLKLLGIIPKLVKRTAGVDTTADIPTIPAPDGTDTVEAPVLPEPNPMDNPPDDVA